MRSKRIALQEGLHDLAQQLREAGYEIVSLDEGGEPLDVMIYSGENKKYLAHNLSGELKVPANNQFVNLLNADEFDHEELIRQIEMLE